MNLEEKFIELSENLSEVLLAQKEERAESLNDRRFVGVTGASYENFYETTFSGKPRIEIDKVSLQLARIEGEYRRNKIGVSFIAEDDNHATTAENATDMFRATRLEELSDEAELNAFSEALRGGLGAFRIRVIENDPSVEDSSRDITFEPIFDADQTVFFDSNAKRQDKSDAEWCAVILQMTPRAYEKQFKTKPTTNVAKLQTRQYEFFKPKFVYVAEYYEIERKKVAEVEYLDLLGNPHVFTEEELTDEFKQELADRSYILNDDPKVLSKKKKRYVQSVHKYIIDGSTILEDCGVIAGTCLPIIPVYGERFYIDGSERFFGKVRKAKDIVRLRNVQMSKLVETAAYSTIEKPIFTPEQIRGNETLWETDIENNYNYLLLNPITDANGNAVAMGAVGYTKTPQIPQALAALLSTSDVDLNDVLGNQQGGEAIVSNISGKAVELIQNKITQQSYIYLSNMAKALKRAAEVWLSVAREVIDTNSTEELKGLSESGTRTSFQLNQEEKTGDTFTLVNDFSVAMSATTSIGASSDSKKEATTRQLLELLSVSTSISPELSNMLLSTVVLNLDDATGIKDLQKFVRMSLIKNGALEPTEEEAKELQQMAENQQPDANTEFVKAQTQKTMSDIQAAQVKNQKTIVDTEKVKAETEKILQELGRANHEEKLQILKRIALVR